MEDSNGKTDGTKIRKISLEFIYIYLLKINKKNKPNPASGVLDLDEYMLLLDILCKLDIIPKQTKPHCLLTVPCGIKSRK